MRHPLPRALRLPLALLLAAGACDDATPTPSPYVELEAQGYARFRGAFSPTEVGTSESGDEVYRFAPEGDGPRCLEGGRYAVSVRDTGADDVVIYLQGGGACWSALCIAIKTAREGVPTVDVLDVAEPANPVAAWNVVYVPYCDGSLFSGDRAHDDDGDGVIDRDHRGLKNLSAALDVAHGRFPTPRRVLLAGSSGGGFGTIIAAPLARMVWPEAELLVFNDAGVGVAKGADPAFLRGLIEEFGATSLIPATCPDCLDDGHLLRFVAWQLDRDPSLRVAVFSSLEDTIIADWFLQIGGAPFEAALRAQTGAVHAQFPERYRRLLVEGDAHTMLLGDVQGFLGDDVPAGIDSLVRLGGLSDPATGGGTTGAWLRAFVEQSPEWTDRVP